MSATTLSRVATVMLLGALTGCGSDEAAPTAKSDGTAPPSSKTPTAAPAKADGNSQGGKKRKCVSGKGESGNGIVCTRRK